MYWECIELTTCETSFHRRRVYVNKLSLSRESMQNQPLWQFNATDPDFIDYHIWGKVGSRFSACYLTFPKKDKLIAISGVARGLSIAAHDTYLAGLWRKPLPQQLRWISHHAPDRRCQRVPVYRAPSWSWASIDGAVILPTYPFREQDSAVRIVDAWTRPVREDGDLFGLIAAGSIRLIGTLVKLVYKRSEEFERQGWLGGARYTVTPDEEPFQENTVLYCLPLELQPESVLGLVIELTGNAKGQYVRRGLIFSGVQ